MKTSPQKKGSGHDGEEEKDQDDEKKEDGTGTTMNVVVVPGLLPRALPFKSSSWARQQRTQAGERRHFKRLRQMIAYDNDLEEKERQENVQESQDPSSTGILEEDKDRSKDEHEKNCERVKRGMAPTCKRVMLL